MKASAILMKRIINSWQSGNTDSDCVFYHNGAFHTGSAQGSARSVWTRSSSDFQCKSEISEPFCRMFTLVALLGLGSRAPSWVSVKYPKKGTICSNSSYNSAPGALLWYPFFPECCHCRHGPERVIMLLMGNQPTRRGHSSSRLLLCRLPTLLRGLAPNTSHG